MPGIQPGERAFHTLEHVRVEVLQGNVEVRDDFRFGGHDLDELPRYAARIAVKASHPIITVERTQIP